MKYTDFSFGVTIDDIFRAVNLHYMARGIVLVLQGKAGCSNVEGTSSVAPIGKHTRAGLLMLPIVLTFSFAVNCNDTAVVFCVTTSLKL